MWARLPEKGTDGGKNVSAGVEEESDEKSLEVKMMMFSNVTVGERLGILVRAICAQSTLIKEL